MNVKFTTILQSIFTGLQVANVYTSPFPKVQPWIALAIGGVQGALAVGAHYTNPDGTPAAAPWIK